jgi:hypothetical protein
VRTARAYFRKLRRVLRVPIEGTRSTPVDTHRIGTALLWSPSPEEELDLRFDWEELAGIAGSLRSACVGNIGQGQCWVRGRNPVPSGLRPARSQRFHRRARGARTPQRHRDVATML